MIPSYEIQEMARGNGVPTSTVERDYAQNWFLKAFFDQGLDIVLKGGTGIRKAHIPGFRFSDDLDFGLLQDIDDEMLKQKIASAVTQAGIESGINFEENVRLEPNKNGYEGRIYFRMIRPTGDPLRVKLDFTEKENERLLFPTVKKTIIHPFSDSASSEINVYSLEESMAEKIRSLFQRVRGRDLYDVWFLHRIMNTPVIGEAIRAKCSFKKVDMNLKTFLGNRNYFDSEWRKVLAHQMKEVPDFNIVFSEVVEIVTGLEAKSG